MNEEKNNSKKKIVIPIAVGLVILIIGGSIFAITTSRKDNDKTENIASQTQEQTKEEKKEDKGKEETKKDKEKEDVLFADNWTEKTSDGSVAIIGSVGTQMHRPSYQAPVKPAVKPVVKPSKPAVKPSKPVTKPEAKPEIPLTPLEPSAPVEKPEVKPEIPLTPLEPSAPVEKPEVKPDIPLTPLEPSTPVEKPEEKPEIPLTPLEPSIPVEKPEEKPEIPLTPLEPSIPVEKPEEKPEIPLTPLEPALEWVVDTPAWDEEVDDLDKPIWDWVDTWVVVMRDGSEKVFYDENEMMDFVFNNKRLVASWKTGEQEYKIVGYEKKTIHHPEVGHWEYPSTPIDANM